MTYRAEQENAIAVAVNRDQRHALSTDAFERLKAFFLGDSFAFTSVVCGHLDLVPAFHAPLSYAFCHLTDKLIATLDDPDYDSFSTEQFRREFTRRGIDWRTPEGREAVDHLLDTFNLRVYRGSFKSSIGTHGGGTFIATKDPNRTIWLVSNTDENAWAFCDQIGGTIQSGLYGDLFPERVPDKNLNSLINQKSITLAGRTISHPQTNIEANGYQTKRISAHFDTFILDDLIVRENAVPAMIEGARSFVRSLTGFEMATRRVWRRHEGTIWAQNDDHQLLTSDAMANRCLTIFVPIEVYENGYVENISERGKPTNPTLHPTPKIQELFDKTMLDAAKGAAEWRCNYLLDASGNSGDILFSPAVVDDPTRHWRKEDHTDPRKFRVSRFLRDKQGAIIEKDGKRQRVAFDPWKALYRVMTIDAAWSEGGDNWSTEVEGFDYEMIRFQLANRAENTGMDGWIDAAVELDEIWHPAVIGFDAGAYQDKFIQSLMRTDKRLRRLRSRMVPVRHHNVSKVARLRNGVAEPLKMYRLLLNPECVATRDEMKLYRANDKNAKDGIIDSMAMAPSVAQRRRSPEEEEKRRTERLAQERIRRNSYDPITGVSNAA